MKEYPTQDYPLDVRDGADEFIAGSERLIGRSFLVFVNRVVRVAVLPEFPTEPWPPQFPEEWDAASTKLQALCHVFATTTMSIAPSVDGLLTMRAVRFKEADEIVHTAIWVSAARHSELMEELASLRRNRDVTRFQLSKGAVRWLLDDLLPQVELGAYAREMLCLVR